MRTLLALCLVVLIAATTGGGLSFAQTISGATETSAQAVIALSDAKVAEKKDSYCVHVAQHSSNSVPLAMTAAPSSVCAQDCNGLVPGAAAPHGQRQITASGQSAALLLALAQALQLPPPRA